MAPGTGRAEGRAGCGAVVWFRPLCRLGGAFATLLEHSVSSSTAPLHPTSLPLSLSLSLPPITRRPRAPHIHRTLCDPLHPRAGRYLEQQNAPCPSVCDLTLLDACPSGTDQTNGWHSSKVTGTTASAHVLAFSHVVGPCQVHGRSADCVLRALLVCHSLRRSVLHLLPRSASSLCARDVLVVVVIVVVVILPSLPVCPRCRGVLRCSRRCGRSRRAALRLVPSCGERSR